MSPRERNMAIVLIALILLIGSAAIGYAFVYVPISEKNTAAAKLDDEIQKKQSELATAKAEQVRLAVLQRRSLPPDQTIARREYSEMMSLLLQQAKVPPGYHVREIAADSTGTPALAGKKLTYSKIAFEITFDKADMWAIHDFLLAYYKLDLLHQITLFDIHTEAVQTTAANRGRLVNDRKGLGVKIITEAIILDGAEPRRTLLSVPSAFAAVGGLAGYSALYLTPEATRGLTPIQFAPVLATRSRDYTLLVQNDIFHGPLPLPPSMTVEKIADIVVEADTPIAPVRVRVVGDLGPSGTVKIDAKAENGTLLPAGTVSVNQTDRTIAFAPAKGETGKSKIRVAVLTEDGKKAEATFTVEIKETVAIDEKKLPDISDSIKLIMAVVGSDGTASAVIRDNYNPHTYEIDLMPSGSIKIAKFDHFGAKKKPDRTYRLNDPGMLVISDEEVSSTKRKFKVIAIDGEGLILADLKPDAKPLEKEKPKVSGRPMGPVVAPRPEKPTQGAAEPLALVAGAAATSVQPVATGPTLYRWPCGGSLKAIKEVPKDEAKKILLKAAESGSVDVPGVAAIAK